MGKEQRRVERRAAMRKRMKQNYKNWKAAYDKLHSPEELRKMAAQLADIQSRKQVHDSILVTLLVLHDKFDLGEKRLNRFLEEYNNMVDCVNGRYIKLDEIEAFLKGFNLKIFVGK